MRGGMSGETAGRRKGWIDDAARGRRRLFGRRPPARAKERLTSISCSRTLIVVFSFPFSDVCHLCSRAIWNHWVSLVSGLCRLKRNATRDGSEKGGGEGKEEAPNDCLRGERGTTRASLSVTCWPSSAAAAAGLLGCLLFVIAKLRLFHQITTVRYSSSHVKMSSELIMTFGQFTLLLYPHSPSSPLPLVVLSPRSSFLVHGSFFSFFITIPTYNIHPPPPLNFPLPLIHIYLLVL